MNIGIFTDTYFPQVNGVVTSVYLLKKELEKLGHTIYIITPQDPENHEDDPRVFRIPSVPVITNRRLAIVNYPIVTKKMEKLDLDLIHTQTEFSVGLFGQNLAKKFNIPLIHTYHTLYEEYTHHLGLMGRIPFTKNAAKQYSRLFCNKSDAVIVPTNKVKKILEEYGVERPIHVIPSGIEFDFFEIDDPLKKKQEIRESLGLDESDYLILYLGRIAKEKNVHELIEYVEDVFEEHENVHLAIVGGGPDLELIKRYGLSVNKEHIHFVGEIPWNEVPNYYHAADLFMSCSTSETQGITYIEALICNLPLLVRSDECLEDVLIQGVNGYSFKNKEEFTKEFNEILMHSKSTHMAKNAKKSVQKYSSFDFAKKVLHVYEQVLADQ